MCNAIPYKQREKEPKLFFECRLFKEQLKVCESVRVNDSRGENPARQKQEENHVKCINADVWATSKRVSTGGGYLEQKEKEDIEKAPW